MNGVVGIKEVAERAGVSLGTVSNVLNKPHLVAATTSKRVQAVMAELGFVRNDLARVLRTGGSKTLGMLVLSVANPFFADLAHACEAAAEAEGFTIILGSSNQRSDREARYLELFDEQRVGGMLVAPLFGATEQMRRLHQRGVRMVLFDNNADSDDFCTVALDGFSSGSLSVEHLVTGGRRRLAFAAGRSYLLEDRWLGAQAAARRYPGVQLERLDTPDQTVAAGHAIGALIAGLPAAKRPDAVVAGNDQTAIGLIQALLAAGTSRVPDDIAVMGCDDIDYAASAAVPLTTIRQPVKAIAHEAIRLVLDESDLPDHVHRRVTLAPELVVRQSTTGPPDHHTPGLPSLDSPCPT